MTDTQKNTNINTPVSVLKGIKEKGYIRPTQSAQYLQKMNYALGEFLNSTPTKPQQIVECMQYLSEIGRCSPQFFPALQGKMFDLYDMAATRNELIKNQATTNLFIFFSHISPSSAEQKNKLLDIIQNLPDFHRRRNEIARVTSQIVSHYEQTQQTVDTNVLEKMSNILTKLSTPPMQRGRPRSSSNVPEQKEQLLQCATFIKKHSSELYKDLWERKLHPKRKISNHWDIKEPARVYLTRQGSIQRSYFAG